MLYLKATAISQKLNSMKKLISLKKEPQQVHDTLLGLWNTPTAPLQRGKTPQRVSWI